MDQTRAVSKDCLTENMEQTRASIRETVGELREKVVETFDWHHYINRCPLTSLALMVGTGVFVGRKVARSSLCQRRSDKAREGAEGITKAAGAAPFSEPRSKAAGPVLEEIKRATNQSLSRLGSRLEMIVNRLLDDAIDALEAALVPPATSWFHRNRDRRDEHLPSSSRLSRQSSA